MRLLSNLEQLLHTIDHAILQQETNEQFTLTLKTVKEKIISKFEKIIRKGNSKKISAIHFYQFRILDLMKTISNDLPVELFTTSNNHPLIQLYYTLLDLHIYLEKYNALSLDLRHKIPLIYLLSARQLFAKETPLIIQALSASGIHETAQQIILAPFDEILHNDNINFHQLYYAKAFSQHLQQLPSNSTPDDIESLLIFLNFNDNTYIQHHLKKLSADISSLPTIHQQLNQIKWLLKVNNQRNELAHYQYTPNSLSLKEQILKWLTQESIFLEHKQLHPEPSLSSDEFEKWKSFKIKVDLSVNELGYLLKLLQEEGVIQNENRKEVADFFAIHFATKNQSNISAESLRQKLYNYTSSSAEAVKDLLMRLVKRIKNLTII